jgi:hypothetical protein
MKDKGYKPSNSECYTPPSEPFRIYKTAEKENLKKKNSEFKVCMHMLQEIERSIHTEDWGTR